MLAFLAAVLVSTAAPNAALTANRQPIKDYATENTVYNLNQRANSLYNSKSYAQARDLLLQASAYDPTSYSANVHSDLADCYRELKDYPAALNEAELALKFDPSFSNPYYTQALTYYDMDDFDRAVSYMRKFMQRTNDLVWKEKAQKFIAQAVVYKNLKQAAKLIDAGKYREALGRLEQAAKYDPSDFSASVHGNMAYVLERIGNPERAIKEGNKALALDPTDKETVYTIGLAYQDLGKFNDAIGWLRRYASMETDGAKQQSVNDFIRELADDRAKIDDKDNKLPDYLDQLKAANSVEMWKRDRLPLKVYISEGKGVRGYRPSFRNYIIRAYDTWCQASGNKLNYKIVNDPQKADIKVRWTTEPLVMHENGRDRVKQGLTYVSSDSDSYINAAPIDIETVHAFDPKRVLEDGEGASVCMHEVGHSLGLGHSTCVSDIMYFGSSTKQTGIPSSRDRATIARLYKDYPAVAFVPQSTSTVTPSQFLPPPAFMPPKPPSSEKLEPPLFLPPPAKSESEKLQPPLFVPPPLPNAGAKTDSPTKALPIPGFIPPPPKQNNGDKKPERKDNSPLNFVPPPPKKNH